MRLLGPYIFILVGVLIGIATTFLFKNPMRIAPNVVLGVLGSFFGLWIRDIMDWRLGGNLSGALIAAAAGALTTTIIINLLMNRRTKM
ncbi:MAG: hypothetical protein KTR32_03400 [Granulosicoccus sp.]|nr:hypothetical protein [Granulosicoccus sp.]